jgi:hypothetical protein
MRMIILYQRGTWNPDMPAEIKGIVPEGTGLAGLWERSSTRDYRRSYETVEVVMTTEELEKIR